MSKSRRQRQASSDQSKPAAHAAATGASAPQTPAAREWPSRPWWWCAGLGGLLLVFYANSFSAGLTFDNNVLIAQDPRLRGWDYDHLRLIFTSNYWWPLASNLYRPLTTLSYLFNYTILGNGTNVGGYHLVNFLLHWANACLVLAILRRLGAQVPVAALAAALFAVHPVNTEAVTNIVGRADLLAAFFILLGGWCHLRAAVAATRVARIWWLAGLGVSACLGVLTKENAVMICAWVCLYEWLWRWPTTAGRAFRERIIMVGKEFFWRGCVPLAPGLLLWGWARWWMASSMPVTSEIYTDNPIVGAAPFAGFMTAIGVMGRQWWLLVFPHVLSNDYSYHQIPVFGEMGNGAGDAWAWGSLVMVAALAGTAVALRRRHPLAAWGGLVFFVLLLPTSNLLMTIGSIMADRFLYLPSIGFCTVAALILVGLGEALARLAANTSWPAYARWGVPALVIGLLGLRTLARNADWHDELSLAQSAVAASPASFNAHKGYAVALWNDVKPQDEQAIDAAISQAEIARKILDDPPLPLKWRDDTLYQDLGMYYRLKGQFLAARGAPDKAQDFYRSSVEVLLRAREVDQSVNQTAHESMQRRGRPLEEIPDVGNEGIYLQLAIADAKLGQAAESETAARWAEHLKPDDFQAYELTGEALELAGHPGDAAVEYLAIILLAHTNDKTLDNLARCYGALGQTSPVVHQGASYSLVLNTPLVRQQISQAGAQIVNLYRSAKRFDEAQQWRDKFIQKMGIPAAEFSSNERATGNPG